MTGKRGRYQAPREDQRRETWRLAVANSAPPPIWTAALILTSVSGSAGSFCATATGMFSVTELGNVSTDLSISGEALAAR